MGFIGDFDLHRQTLNIETGPAVSKDKAMILVDGIITGSIPSDREGFILQRYREQGEGFIKGINGYFLILLFDEKKGEFFIYNNRYSNTFCYYVMIDGKLHFSDTIARLLKRIPHVTPDFSVINLFLNSGYSYSEKTVYKGINRMIPGFYLKIKSGKVEQIRYSMMEFSRKPVKNLQNALDKYERLWIDAIRDFSDACGSKRIGSALSGGLDTSWVVYCASQATRPVHTYTCNYQYSLFNEIKRARYVTKRCNGVQHKVEVSEKDLDLLPEVLLAAEEPVLSSSLSLFKLTGEAGKEADILLTGDGGNNIYHHLYPVGELQKYLRNIPYPARFMLFRLTEAAAQLSGWERLYELKYPLHAFSYQDYYRNFYKNLICYRHFMPEQRKSLFRKEYQAEIDEPDMLGYIPIREKSFDDDLISSRFIHGNMEYVSTFQEKFAKHFGMRLFPPYQEQKIMDFLNSLPYDYLFRGNTLQKLTNKAHKMYFQKLALSRHFPKSFVYNTGQPFDQPFHGWFQRRPEAIRLLFKRLRSRGWYNGQYLDRLYEEHKRQKLHTKIYCQLQNHAYRIMALLVLETWALLYLDNRKHERGMRLEEFFSYA